MTEEEELAELRPRAERLKRRAERRAVRATRRGEPNKAALYKRAAALAGRILALLPDPRSESEQRDALRAELHARLSLYVTEENEAETRETLDAIWKQ